MRLRWYLVIAGRRNEVWEQTEDLVVWGECCKFAVMKVSLLISTYNNPEVLRVVFAGLRWQTRMPDEVLVADDGSTDETKAVIDSCREEMGALGVPVVHIWQPDEGFRVAQIRNKAIAAATGDFIIQIDGDIVMHPSFIADHIKWARPGWLSCGKRVFLGENITSHILYKGDVEKQISRLSWLSPDIRNRKNAIHSPLLGKIFRLLDGKRVRHRGCNMSYWRSDAIAVNGYDETFEGWGLEDTDFFERLVRSGLKPQQLACEAVGYHMWHPSNEGNDAVFERNRKILDESRDNNKVKAVKGIDRYINIPKTK